MRTLLVAVFLLLFFIVSIPLFGIELLIGKFNKKWQAKSSQAIVKTALKMILAISGVTVIVSAGQNQRDFVVFEIFSSEHHHITPLGR